MADVTPEGIAFLVAEMLAEQEAGIMAKFPDVEMIREKAWAEGKHTGQVEALNWLQFWITGKLAAAAKYEDTRALSELLDAAQFELGRVQDGSDTVIAIGRGPVIEVGPDADGDRTAASAG